MYNHLLTAWKNVTKSIVINQRELAIGGDNWPFHCFIYISFPSETTTKDYKYKNTLKLPSYFGVNSKSQWGVIKANKIIRLKKNWSLLDHQMQNFQREKKIQSSIIKMKQENSFFTHKTYKQMYTHWVKRACVCVLTRNFNASLLENKIILKMTQ